jgi:hypothetical protein
MSIFDSNWSLYNEFKDIRIDGLTFTQTKGYVQCLEESHRGAWLAWHEGIPDWRPLENFPDLFSENRDREKALPPVPPATKNQVFEETHADFEAGEYNLKSETNQDHRLHRRYQKRYSVKTAALGKGFQTFSVNLSMGGILLENEIPDKFGASFMLLVGRAQGDQIEIFCEMIFSPEGKRTKRVRIRSMNHAIEAKLRGWLLDPRVE